MTVCDSQSTSGCCRYTFTELCFSLLQAELIAKATLTHRQWHLNYGHSIAESVFEVYNTACVYLQSCSLSNTQLVPVFLDRPGSFGWTGAKGNWKTVLPPAAEALQCFFPKPALWIADTALHSRVHAPSCHMHAHCGMLCMHSVICIVLVLCNGQQDVYMTAELCS